LEIKDLLDAYNNSGYN